MSAIESFKQHIAEVATLGEQANQLNASIRQIQGIADEARAPQQEAGQLKAKRRSILARLFLGTGDNSELSETEKAIAAAEAAANAKAPTREGAEAAIEELQRQAAAIGHEIQAIGRDYADLYHAALKEHAKAALPAYQEAVDNLRKAYAEVIGRCRAVDLNSDWQAGRFPAAFGFPNTPDVPSVPTFNESTLFKTHVSTDDLVDAARENAKRHLDAIAMQAANITNQTGATK